MHNYFLQVAAEYGAPALFCWLLLVVSVLATISRAAIGSRGPPHDQGLLIGVAAGQVGFLVMCFFSHPLLLAELQAAYWVFAGLGLSVVFATEKTNPLATTGGSETNGSLRPARST